MSAQAFGLIEVVGYALAAVFAVAAGAYYATHHVREVRGELTGATARAAIQEMRERGVSRLAGGALATPGDGAAPSEVPSGSLHVRFFGTGGTGVTRKAVVAEGAAGQTQRTSSESGTTLLSDAAAPPSESGTTLLSDAAAPPSEYGTTLLSDAAGGAPDSESMTTLLGGERPDGSDGR